MSEKLIRVRNVNNKWYFSSSWICASVTSFTRSQWPIWCREPSFPESDTYIARVIISVSTYDTDMYALQLTLPGRVFSNRPFSLSSLISRPFKMVKCKSICLAILILVHYVPSTISSPVSAERHINATFGHPLMETWRNASTLPFARGPGLELFAKFLGKPLPYGFIEFMRQGVTAFHHRQTLPNRITGFIKDRWSRMTNFIPYTVDSFSSFLGGTNNNSYNYINNNYTTS